MIASIALQIITARLDPSVGESGPHDLAVRKDAFVGALIARWASLRPPHPAPNVRDDRDTPLQWRRDGERIIMNFWKTEEEYFCEGGLT